MIFKSLRPSFAVVGHPNKGKSSIVSTLARNDSVLISRQSGTTTDSNHYKIDTGHAGYELIDTPGFQRPRKVLQWLKKRAERSDQRVAAVKAFVEDQDCQTRFPDEVKLLTPLVNGAAILYVVDGSRPFGIEYESEMEVLRWTGQPSMALINPIENESHIESWRNALDQYFKIVRVFNPMQADFKQQIALLDAFSHLQPSWQQTLAQVIIDLKSQQQIASYQSSELLANLLVELCSYQVQQKVLTIDQANSLKNILQKKYNSWMKDKEQATFKDLCGLFSHHQATLENQEINLPPDLFDSRQWYAWGLNKNQLALVSGMTGMATGAALDFAVAGHSFMLGAIGGGAIGYTSAWFGADKLVKTKIKGLPLGGYQAAIGPIQNKNFPYVVIGRFINLYQQLKSKNHADRSHIILSSQEENKNTLQNKIEALPKQQAKLIHLACNQLSSQKAVEQLPQTLMVLFEETS